MPGPHAEGKSSWERRFGHTFETPLLHFEPLVRHVPPPESRFRTAKTGGAMIPGIHLGYVHTAGGMIGPESYVVPLRQLGGLNMESGRAPEGKRPIIEKSDQVYGNILGGTAEDQYLQFPLRKACEKAMTEVRSVTIPPAGEAAA
eukprot:1283035-Pyramimonas_sp.AAC.1